MRRRRRFVRGIGRALCVGGLAVAAAAPAEAQWPAGVGQGWVKLTGISHSTERRYDADGEERSFFAGGESVSRAIFLDALVGVHPWVDLWLQLPWFDLSFTDAAGERTASGIGDARGYVRWAFGHHLLGGVPLSLRLGAKVPVRDFPLDAEVIPVGEGQWDLEAWLEAGHSFHPAPLYAVAWIGYRWRLENEVARRDPGDERAFLVDLGLTTAPVGAKLVVEGFVGDDPVIQGVRVGQGHREIVTVQPEVLVHLPRAVTLQVGFREPIHGVSYPAGRQLLVAVFVRRDG